MTGGYNFRIIMNKKIIWFCIGFIIAAPLGWFVVAYWASIKAAILGWITSSTP